MPPSTNKLYQRRRGGQVALTPQAHKFREGVKKKIASQILSAMTFPVNQELVYRIDISLYFEALENPGWFEFWKEDKFYTKDIKWPKKSKRAGQVRYKKDELKVRGGERKAASRYKQIDYDNRIKFLQDSLVAVLGIPDDSQIFGGHQEKRQDKNNPRAEVTVTVEDLGYYIEERR